MYVFFACSDKKLITPEKKNMEQNHFASNESQRQCCRYQAVHNFLPLYKTICFKASKSEIAGLLNNPPHNKISAVLGWDPTRSAQISMQVILFPLKHKQLKRNSPYLKQPQQTWFNFVFLLNIQEGKCQILCEVWNVWEQGTHGWFANSVDSKRLCGDQGEFKKHLSPKKQAL